MLLVCLEGDKKGRKISFSFGLLDIFDDFLLKSHAPLYMLIVPWWHFFLFRIQHLVVLA